MPEIVLATGSLKIHIFEERNSPQHKEGRIDLVAASAEPVHCGPKVLQDVLLAVPVLG